MSTALVLVTHTDGIPDDVSLQAVAFARMASGEAPAALVIGSGDGTAGELVATLGEHGVATVHLARHPALASFAPDAWARILVDLGERLGVDMFVGPGSDAGNDVLARAAARMGEPFAANCTAVTPGRPLAVTRVRWGGSLLEEARVHGSRPVLSVAPHAVAAEAVGGSATVEASTPQLSDADLVVQVKERVGVATLQVPGLSFYAAVCGWALARSHARSGDAVAISAYLGTADTFDGALADFAETYADVNARDHAAYVAAIESGRVSTTAAG